MFTKINQRITFILLSILLLIIETQAHCDSMEGPVVKAAKKALETGNINYVLVWIKPDYETEVKALFEKVINVRKLNLQAQEIADMYFYETVVRIHRLGENEPYTGLKPAGYKIPEGIKAADFAIEIGSLDNVLKKVDNKFHDELKKLFENVMLKKNYDINNVNEGREYVKSYVHFIHYVENLFGENSHNQHLH